MDLSGYGPTAQVLLCGGAVLTLYLLFGILQEWLLKHAFRPPESSVREVARSAGWFVSLLQFGCYASFETMQREKGAKVLEGRKAPFSAYMMLGMLQVCCLALSNVAVQYLNYPTHVLFKSAKPIPTLLVGALYLQRKYSRLDYGAALMMIFGLVLFVAADEQQHVSTYGFILVSIALVAETYIVSVQDKVMTQYRAPQHEVVLYTHACGAAMLLTACIISGELPHGLATLARHPAVLLAILLFSACGYYGAAALRALVKYRGQFTGLVTTTARKALALVLSVVLFPKRWGAQYTLGALLFLIGTLVSAGPAKMRLRAWLGDTSVGKLLKLDARRSRAERILA